MKTIEPILQTKLQPPQAKGKILKRQRLLTILNNNLDKKLILICADAGYGKTTLLSQFCDELDAPYFFYTLDANDNDIATFFRYVAEGMNRHASDFSDRIRSIIPHTRDVHIIVGTFVNAFMAVFKDDFYFILDDFHHLQQNREIGKMIDYLLRNAPSNFHIIIASRATPNLRLDHYSAKQELFKIEKEELRFTSKELQSLLWDIYGLKIASETVKNIEEHSEGWVTAIQLVLQKLSTTSSSRVQETFENYITSGEDILNYFAGEVFESLPTSIRTFLMHTAILEILTPETCNFLLNTRQSRKTLSYLEIEHIFVTRVGNGYKYHPLFHEFLLKRLREYYASGTIKNFYNKMGGYHVRNREFPLAVNNFLKAENYNRAAVVLDKNYRLWRYSGEYINFLTLIDSFPETVIADQPNLLMKKVRILLYLGKIDNAMKILKPIITRFQRKKDRKILAEAFYNMGSLYLYIAKPRRALLFFKKALTLTPKNDVKRQIEIFVSVGNSYRLLGEYSKTQKYLSDALISARQINDFDLEVQVLKNLAYLYWAMFNYKKAEEIFREIFARFERGKIYFELGKIYADAAMVNIYNFHIKEASINLERAQEFVSRYNDHSTDIYQTFATGDLLYAQHNYAKAIECYRGVLGFAKQQGDKLFASSVLLSMAMTYLKMGRIIESEKALYDVESFLDERIAPVPYIEFLIISGDIQFTRGMFKEALLCYEKALSKSTHYKQEYMKMRVCYQMCRIYLAMHDQKAAIGILDRSIAVAQEQEYDAFLIYEGHCDISLLEFGLKNDINNDYLVSILEAIDSYEAKRLLSRINMEKGTIDLECFLFGDLQIKDNQAKLVTPNWRTKNAKAMFEFLIVHQHEGCTKDQLIDTFWPDKDLRDAAHSLQVEISSLRNLIKEMSKTEMPTKQLILYRNQKYIFNSCFVLKTDLQQFEGLLKEAEPRETSDPSYALKIYEKAVNLYRGDFCQDLTDEWANNIRSYYRELIIKVLKKIALFYYEKNDYAHCLKSYCRAITFDKYDETLHIGALRCYQAMGDRKGIKRQYDNLLAALKELGIETPSQEAVQILQKAIR